MYEYLDAAVVRAPVWQPGRQSIPWPDLTGPDATPVSWRAWLDQVWQIADFAVAVEAASPDLACRVAQIRAGRAVPERVVRRVVLSTLRYLLRAISRPTPFGLLAGVAAARFGAVPALRAGARHQAVARAGTQWLAGMIEHLETDASLRTHLAVMASDLIVGRGGQLVIEHRSSGSAGGAPARVQIRATPPVQAALDAARRPIRVSDLADTLEARFPGTASRVVDTLLAQLVRQQFLITSLRPLMTASDPLAALLDGLQNFPITDEAMMSGLNAIRAGLQRHDLERAGAARDERGQALALMQTALPAARPALAIDLRLDWDLVIPRAVAAEAASAAGLLARLARRPVLSSGWADWHSRFLDRYGPGAVVPVLDAVDSGTGLGYPAGYLGSPPSAAGPLTGRDETLLKLASTAAMRGCREVVLDDALVGELAVVGPDDPVQPSAELTVRIHAASLLALEDGQFTLHVTGVSRAAGATAGRFLGSIIDADGRMRARYAAVPGVHHGVLLAQVCTVPLYANAENVARTPQAAEMVISLGEHREPGPGQLPVTDLAVTADARRLHLVSLSRRRPVHTMLLSAIDLAYHCHPLARFLIEAPVALAAPCTGFEWGAAAALPFLPALRYGRTIVSPARWVLTAADVPGPAVCWAGWGAALARWGDQVGLPGRVWLGEGDQCISLDTAEPAHRALLRAHLDRAGKALLTAAPAAEDLGWAEGRAHEIVIPVARTRPAAGPVRWPGEITRRDHGHLPGCDAQLDLRLYGRGDVQDAILTQHLPLLLARLGGQARWWFVRYRDPEEHLRLRVTLAAGGVGGAVEQVGQWTQTLRRAGLITHVSWETYYPQTARFGGSAAIDAAEDFFAADSAAVLAQLTTCTGNNGPDARALTAASMTNIATGLIGDRCEAMRWLIEHTEADSAAPPRDLYDQAIALAIPASGHPAAVPAVDAHVAVSWLGRHSALEAYRAMLERAATIRPPDVLPDLLHLHHARMSGPDLSRERAILHLARAAALSWMARTSPATRS